ncbi:MAG: succinate dehydrogenase / fumarate reductase, cytochrome b subunit [Myxococcales bacterium]|jgi:succinate dehydrogenase / fumarate reductase cytochrome b subunit|nr:succinate dehydrogenase / fumarate reductase, cytochrome b subunit [Myxococcales bacterium]
MAAATDTRDRRGSLAQRLFSLSGVVPLGAFLLFHLWTLSSLGGARETYDRQVGFLHGGPVLGLLEVVLVIVPLLYHAVYGVMRTFQPRDPNHAYATDVMYTLQRASGIVVLVFVAAHVWEFRAQTWTRGLAVSSYSTKLVEHLSSTQSGVPLVALGYLVGIAATVFHLANGMTSFSTTWGFAPTFTARHRQRIFFRVLGIVLFAWSAALVVQLATGTRFFPAEEPRGAPATCGSDAVSPSAPPHAHQPSTPSSARPMPSGGLPGGDR